MRAQSIRFLKDYPLFHPISGSAENTGLPSKSIDLITAAQLFHWFDADAFRTECQRILKPNGKVALILNTRDESSRIVPETAALFRKFCTEFKGFSNGIGTQDAAAAFLPIKIMSVRSLRTRLYMIVQDFWDAIFPLLILCARAIRIFLILSGKSRLYLTGISKTTSFPYPILPEAISAKFDKKCQNTQSVLKFFILIHNPLTKILYH